MGPDLNALDGIFHEQTIICEDDSDCRLFNAVADHDAAANKGAYPDTAYTPTGGKDRAHKVAAVLRKIGVPVRCVFDIDILADAEKLKRIVEAMGGSFELIAPLQKQLDAAIRDGINQPSDHETRKKLQNLLAGDEGAPIPYDALGKALKKQTPWRQMKASGISHLPKGECRAVYQALEEALAKIGIYPIREGEVEAFAPALGGHGPGFVERLLEEIPLGDARLNALNDFVRRSHGAEIGVT